MTAILILLALVGWGVAGWLWQRARTHVCPVEVPTKAVLVNAAGLPESLRSIPRTPPETYSRPHGKGAATIYRRVGTAILYQPR